MSRAATIRERPEDRDRKVRKGEMARTCSQKCACTCPRPVGHLAQFETFVVVLRNKENWPQGGPLIASRSSQVLCTRCWKAWRTESSWVDDLPNATRQQLTRWRMEK